MNNSFSQLEQSSLAFIHTYQEAVKEVMVNYHHSSTSLWQDIFNTQKIYQQWMTNALSNSENVWSAQLKLLQEYSGLNIHLTKWMLDKNTPDYIVPADHDKRFKTIEWRENAFFYYLYQMYLVLVKNFIEFVENNPTKHEKINQKMLFFTKQFLDALSPSNYIMTNPHVLKKTLETNGENLIKGFTNFLEDLVKGNGHWNIKMTNTNAFKIGENIAVTPGKVVFQNKLMQLIQYAPTTAKVRKTPLLIVPPWINKYYILDLTEKNSFVKWIVDQGITVFMISWVNPDIHYRNTSFEDYLFKGIIEAIDVITEITNSESVNTVGFCIGGTLLSVALAYFKGRNDGRIKSATFLTTLIDFSQPGDLGALIDETQVSAIEDRMKKEGFLDGRLLMTTFNLLRANELFWSFYIKNYLCGQDPFSFDLLFWNCDSTNLPEKMNSYYLRNMYLHNKLAKNELKINNVKIDLSIVNTPCYFLSTEQDHIAPWKSTFMSAKCLGGPVTFVLAGSGHIAGIVNPPSSRKYSYNFNPHEQCLAKDETDCQWLKNTVKEEGSWWKHWIHWLQKYSGSYVTARVAGGGKFKPLEDAPGTYVRKTL